MEIYQPPYFFRGVRPIIDSVSDLDLRYGAIFSIATRNANEIRRVVLMRPGSVTHHTDPGQRSVPLRFELMSMKLSVTMETDPNVAPPGYYMLFIVDGEGRPCQQAVFVRLRR